MWLKMFKPFSILLAVVSLSACSLLEVKFDSQTTPLTQQELNMRILTREYAKSFFSQVEDSAERISRLYESNDKQPQTDLLLWQIYALEGMQNSAYQVSPTAGLIDTWVFTLQMEHFFNTGAGQDLFASDDAKQTSKALTEQVEKLAKRILGEQAYLSSRTFVHEFARSHPFDEIWFRRSPAFNDWLKYQNIDESEAVSTLGTMPEALGDVSDRLSLVSEQTPKIMAWKAELIAMHSTVSGEKLNQTLDSITQTSYKFQDFVENNPEYMQHLAQQMGKELQPLLKDLNSMTSEQMAKLSQEREAFDQMVERERTEIALVVAEQRTLMTEDLEKLSKEVVALALQELTKLIKGVLIYFILFVLVIFFAPFGLGYFVGKKVSNNS
ncbi:chemotaxis protein [Vibrio sp. SCSIO 43136]|uniref:chemotaxis protein n=1 Tax=Vibrio sp. SCSIO 43136 TaxID=2819101 RepID=UPI00207542EA|nr:chemotaxis protein [Vibrio sp. SCSIO 43136]USD66076.1 chemotaxis protein [Vibrio sp. SCSIO 43136]